LGYTSKESDKGKGDREANGNPFPMIFLEPLEGIFSCALSYPLISWEFIFYRED
jgi:hypothetical protein